MSKRPPAPIRALVLVVALLALVSAMCARSKSHPAAPETPAPEQQTGAAADAAPAEKPPDAEYFPATKSSGFLIKGDEKKK